LSDFSISQITNDSEGILNFDVSIINGNIIYSNPSSVILFDPKEPTLHKTILSLGGKRIAPPSWSPDGKFVALNYDGIEFYYPNSSTISSILVNRQNDPPYINHLFSYDSSMLAIEKGLTYSIYKIKTGEIQPLRKPSNGPFYSCCANLYWTSDSNHLYISENRLLGSPYGIIYPGLWRYSITGEGEELFSSIEASGQAAKYYKILAPWEDVKNKMLYFLLSPPETDVNRNVLPYYFMRSRIDGKIIGENIYQSPFYLFASEMMIWESQGKFIVFVQFNVDNNSSNMILLSSDPQIPLIILMDDANSVIGNLRLGP
jgi:hypothetical protein